MSLVHPVNLEPQHATTYSNMSLGINAVCSTQPVLLPVLPPPAMQPSSNSISHYQFIKGRDAATRINQAGTMEALRTDSRTSHAPKHSEVLTWPKARLLFLLRSTSVGGQISSLTFGGEGLMG